eukprot:jgi/Chlat1/2689/Chrsp180S08751
MSLLEGKTASQGFEKLRQGFRPTFINGCAFWPAVNMFNFMVLPPTGRVACAALAGLVWNSYLSFTNARLNRLKSVAAAP